MWVSEDVFFGSGSEGEVDGFEVAEGMRVDVRVSFFLAEGLFDVVVFDGKPIEADGVVDEVDQGLLVWFWECSHIILYRRLELVAHELRRLFLLARKNEAPNG